MNRDIAALAFCALVLSGLGCPPAQAATLLTTEPHFDRAAYLGRWYQIALIPNRFQAQCVGDTSADYSALPENLLQVTNRCRTEGGQQQAIGVSRPHREHPDNPAILQGRFAPAWLSFLPFVWGDYWVIQTLGHYDAALVGSPDRQYLWILARTPTLDDAHYAALVATAKAQGFDVSQLRRE
jgi:apolipoprotein D and lipocalin family protein